MIRWDENAPSCARCTASFPHVNIITCQNLINVENLCCSCHRGYHPECILGRTVVRWEDLICRLCHIQVAAIVCPRCKQHLDHPFDGLALCRRCEAFLHDGIKAIHRDHIYPVASINSPFRLHQARKFVRRCMSRLVPRPKPKSLDDSAPSGSDSTRSKVSNPLQEEVPSEEDATTSSVDSSETAEPPDDEDAQ